MSAGFEFNGTVTASIVDQNEVETPLDNTNNQYYNLVTDTPDSCNDLGKCDFHIVFTPKFITDYVNKTSQLRVNVDYTAKLTAYATFGVDNPNTNDAEISYGDHGRFTKKVTTETYSFEIPIFKYTYTSVATRDEIRDAIQKPLSGAKFKITATQPADPDNDTIDKASGWLKFKEVTDDSGKTVYKYDATGDVTEFTSGDDGYIRLQGLDAGTYYLYESAAPSGYNVLHGSTMITIDRALNKNETPCKIGNIYKDENLAQAQDYIGIENNTGAVLPSTGGIGTTIFYIAGSVLLIGALILLIVKKRMKDQD